MLPDAFENGLRNLDPALSLRWGNAYGCYIVERAGRIGRVERNLLYFAATESSKNPAPEPKAIEEWRSAQAGKQVVTYVKVLDPKVYDHIMSQDLQRHGQAVVDRHLAKAVAKKAAETVKQQELAKETGEIIHWALNNKYSAIEAGKAEQVIASASHRPVKARTKDYYIPLVDSVGVPLSGRKNVSITLASK